ncbi:Putative amino acid/polyamine transporter I [Septoria linicola]|uniref:Amino acid/polyamine transporter I n=1 Tax=Septoria linicola TaxID=215465 RepID=A0A9Q9EJU6_9PEZI|nr:Putative amino acid/polyamine transporter I [Septoria linicola]
MDIETGTDNKSIRKNSIQSLNDAHDLAILGHVEELTRKFDLKSMLALAFCVLGTWGTLAVGLSSGLSNGGPISILWGLVLVFICNVCVALSLGELCSAMPTALGQAYYVHRLFDTPMGRFASYMCAWINTFGWWTLTASQVAFMTNFMLGIKVMFDSEWTGAGKGWVQFIVYLGITFLFTGVNIVSCRKDKILPIFNDVIGIWFIVLFFVISLALLISVGTRQGMTYQPASFVFGEWLNATGWGGGVVWFTGLLQGAYALTAFDAVIHLVEEIPEPRKNAPKIIWLAVVLGAITGFIFMVVCLFCIQDLDLVIDGPTGLPFTELIQQTVGLEGGCVLLTLFVVNGLGQGVSIATTGSRLTWGFARDAGIPWSAFFSKVDNVWKVPARALWLQGVLIGLIGILYLFANTVLEAILSVATIALTISYGMPILALLLAGRDKLPADGTFKLGKFGPVINWVSVIYCSITTVFFFFPGEPNPAPADMNYAIAVFGIMLVIALGFWFVTGRRTYLMTDEAAMRIEMARRLEGKSSAEPNVAQVKSIS